MNVEESAPSPKRLGLIDDVAGDAAAYLNFDLETDSPHTIIQKLDQVVVDLAFHKPTPIPDDEKPHLVLGALWGAQMARQFQWYWANVIVDGKSDEVAMISPNQEMIIFPFPFVAACLNRRCICTILLAFNMLLEDRMGEIPSSAYENLMLNVRHVIPPYSLESS